MPASRRLTSLLTAICFLLAVLVFPPPARAAYPWQVSIPPQFIRLFSSDPEYDTLINDLLYRHYSARVGPGPLTGNQQTNWRRWDILVSAFIDTANNKIQSDSNKPSVYGQNTWPADDRHDFKSELKLALEATTIDPNGYVWMYGSNKPGWPFPTPQCFPPNYSAADCNDTRHPVTNTAFVIAATDYVFSTLDTTFLKNNIGRIRKAIRFLQTDQQGDTLSLLQNSWSKHDGKDDSLGSNYWDIMPFGWRDAYATVQYYAALSAMGQLEAAIETSPQWNIPVNPNDNSAAFLAKAQRVKQTAGNYFWFDPQWNGSGPKSHKQGRFIGTVAKDNQIRDFGFVFLNLEAIYYDFANPQQAQAIYDWLDGRYSFSSDTSQGADIYKWIFAPRATTKNNPNWYWWGMPHNRKWEDQVQNGGTAFFLSYYDLVDRLHVLGADNAYSRLSKILNWYKTVQTAGGYRAYYNQNQLQGCGKQGTLGIDCSFTTSTLVPLSHLYGFLGLKPGKDGLLIHPRLPSALTTIGVDNLAFAGNLFKITAHTTGSPSIAQTGPNRFEITAVNNQPLTINAQNPLSSLPTSTPTPTPTPSPLSGDLDADADVDIADYNLLLQNFANPYTVFDLNTLIQNFGQSR